MVIGFGWSIPFQTDNFIVPTISPRVLKMKIKKNGPSGRDEGSSTAPSSFMKAPSRRKLHWKDIILGSVLRYGTRLATGEVCVQKSIRWIKYQVDGLVPHEIGLV
jgi:hypothetical protein